MLAALGSAALAADVRLDSGSLGSAHAFVRQDVRKSVDIIVPPAIAIDRCGGRCTSGAVQTRRRVVKERYWFRAPGRAHCCGKAR
ncbi:MAG: hypothetical protein AAGF45_12230 [Pseudomonadota bacterium]